MFLQFSILCALGALIHGDRFISEDVHVKVNTSFIVNTINKDFISFALDFSLLSENPRWLRFNFSSEKLRTLLRSHSPAVLRIGGSGASSLFFSVNEDVLDAAKLKPKGHVLEKDDVDKLVELTRMTGTRLLIDLDLQQRYGNQWDPSNAIQLMDFCMSRSYGENLDWELGNEPEYYQPATGQLKFTADQIADDFEILYRVIRSYGNLASSRIVGPDVVQDPSEGTDAYKILQAVVNTTGRFLTAATFHQYYFRGDLAKYEEYLDPKNFQLLLTVIDNVKKAVSSTQYPLKSLWIGESSDAWHSGTVNVSDRFVSCFLWLDKLGVCARQGVNLIVRQTLYGGFYSLLDILMDPNPDYWISWVHRSLVGQGVFDVSLSSSTARVYAHCTKVNPDTGYKPGAVTVFVVNINTNISLSLIFQTQELFRGYVDMYLLTPGKGEGIGSVLSKEVMLNGDVLKMPNETSMPKLMPVTLSAEKPIDVPPLSLAFLVFPEAVCKACMG